MQKKEKILKPLLIMILIALLSLTASSNSYNWVRPISLSNISGTFTGSSFNSTYVTYQNYTRNVTLRGLTINETIYLRNSSFLVYSNILNNIILLNKMVSGDIAFSVLDSNSVSKAVVLWGDYGGILSPAVAKTINLGYTNLEWAGLYVTNITLNGTFINRWNFPFTNLTDYSKAGDLVRTISFSNCICGMGYCDLKVSSKNYGENLNASYSHIHTWVSSGNMSDATTSITLSDAGAGYVLVMEETGDVYTFVTDSNGDSDIKISYPDSITAWLMVSYGGKTWSKSCSIEGIPV